MGKKPSELNVSAHEKIAFRQSDLGLEPVENDDSPITAGEKMLVVDAHALKPRDLARV